VLFKVCGGALLCVAAILFLKGARGDVWPLEWAGTLLLCGAALSLLAPIVSYLGELCALAGVGEMASLLLRGLGVALLTQLSSDLCRQCGEAALAGGVELAGKAELLLLCLPQLKGLVEAATGLLSNGG
jgi:stage III sporulation protein AD